MKMNATPAESNMKPQSKRPKLEGSDGTSFWNEIGSPVMSALAKQQNQLK